MNTPSFKTERLLLREITIDDADLYEKHFNDYEVIQHLSIGVPWPYPKGGAKYFIENVLLPELNIKRWFWVISLKSNPSEIIGAIDLFREGIPENRGFWLGKKFWGNGYMTEAVLPTIEYAFNSLNFEKLIFSNALGNERSRRVKEKTAAKFIGTKESKLVNPEYTQSELWELTKEDWLAFKNS